MLYSNVLKNLRVEKSGSSRCIYAIVVLQAMVVLLTAFNLLPRVSLLYLMGAVVLYMATLLPLQAVRFFILSIPWFIAVPLTTSYDRLQSWRLLVLELLLLWLIYNWRGLIRILKINPNTQTVDRQFVSVAKGLIKFLKLSYLDAAFFVFLAALLLTSLAAPFWQPGVRYVIWLFNIYLLLVAVRLVVNSAGDWREIVKTTAYSGLTIVVFGFVQLFVFLQLHQEFFWQYWSNTIISTLYSPELGRLTIDHNSWFAYFPDSPPNLRMFSLLPGSHYFALICVLTLPFVLLSRQWSSQKKLWTASLVFTLLGIVFSGVRGAWVAAVVPLVFFGLLYLLKKISKSGFKKATGPLVIFLLLFLLSPLLQEGLNFLSLTDRGGLFYRAGSSFNLNETSNAKRLAIWKLSLENVKEQPILGTGPGNFAYVFGQPAEGQSLAEFLEEDDPILEIPKKYLSAHNLYLNVLVENGLIGFAALMFLLTVIARALWLRFKKGENDFTLYVALSFIWVAAYSFFDVIVLHNDKILMYIFISLALLESSSYSSRESASREAPGQNFAQTVLDSADALLEQ